MWERCWQQPIYQPAVECLARIVLSIVNLVVARLNAIRTKLALEVRLTRRGRSVMVRFQQVQQPIDSKYFEIPMLTFMRLPDHVGLDWLTGER